MYLQIKMNSGNVPESSQFELESSLKYILIHNLRIYFQKFDVRADLIHLESK